MAWLLETLRCYALTLVAIFIWLVVLPIVAHGGLESNVVATGARAAPGAQRVAP